MLTKKQHQLLLFIDKRLRQEGVPPSFEEMKEEVGLKSKSGIHRLISALEERGFVRRMPHRARALEIVRLPEGGLEEKSSEMAQNLLGQPESNVLKAFDESLVANSVELPRYGKIAAGTPIEALCSPETIVVPANMVGTGEHYALTIAGDSMIEAGIMDGDTVIIRKTAVVDNGEIAVALVDGCEATLKKIKRENGKILLQPCNQEYETRVYLPERITIQGKLVGLMRHYD